MSIPEPVVPEGRAQICLSAPGLEPALCDSLAQSNPALTVLCVAGLGDLPPGAGHAPVVLVRPAPFAALAHRLAGAGDSLDTVAAWAQDTQALLDAARPLRRRLVLVDRAALVAGDPVLHDALTNRLGVSLLPAGDLPQDPADPSLAQRMIMAHALIYSDERLLALARGVEALTQPSGQPDNALAEAIRTALADLQPAADPSGDLHAIVAERDLLRAALAEVLGDVDSHMAQIAAAQAEQTRLRAALVGQDVLLADLASVQRRFADAEKDRLHREDRTGQVVLDMALQIDALSDALAERTAECHALRAEIDRIVQSKSWRVTAPLRATRRTLGRSD
jgi:hypothetical protein